MPDKAPAKAELKIDDKVMDLPVIVGTEDEHGLDIGKLRAQTGYVTLDPAYMNTASTTSAITFLDGEQGILRYRGIPIEELAEKSTFVEISYLLIYGHLPNKTELDAFSQAADPSLDDPRGHEALLRRLSRHRAPDGDPVGDGAVAVQLLPGGARREEQGRAAKRPSRACCRRCAPSRRSRTRSRSASRSSTRRTTSRYCANFLNMMFAVPAEPYEIDEDIVKVLNLLLILHADHEQNCSTSTVRLVGSSQANLFASISAGICALWGPLHGGANQEVLEMLEAIQDGRRRAEEVRRPGQEEGLGLPADGLRPPRLQELRPAREDHQGRRRQGPGEDEARPTRCSTSPRRWKRRR